MQQMNGIAVRVDRIKGRCRCDITGTVNYWVLLEVGGHAARFAEPPRFTCMNLNILLPLYNDVYLFTIFLYTTFIPLLMLCTPFECANMYRICSKKDSRHSSRVSQSEVFKASSTWSAFSIFKGQTTMMSSMADVRLPDTISITKRSLDSRSAQ